MLLQGSPHRVTRGLGIASSVTCAVLLLVSCASAVTPASGVGPAPGSPGSLTDELARLSAAVVAHDSAALARAVAPRATSEVRALVARTVALPLTAWAFVVESTANGPAAGERIVTALLHYRLRSDPVDATGRRHLVLASTGGTWRLVSDDAVGAGLPWDLGVVGYAAGPASDVLTPGARPSDPDLSAEASGAARAVTAVWGTGWRQAPVVVAVHGGGALAAMTGRTVAGVAGLVAISTPDRVYVDLDAYTALDPASRAVLLTHEVTHVATAAGADTATPQWLKEGFADYVGFLHSSIGAPVAAASLLAQVRRSGPPATVPADDDYAPGATQRAVADAYAGGWLMCVLIASTQSERALVAVYRATAAGTGTPAANVDAALRQVTGRSLASWTASWQRDLRRRAG